MKKGRILAQRHYHGLYAFSFAACQDWNPFMRFCRGLYSLVFFGLSVTRLLVLVAPSSTVRGAKQGTTMKNKSKDALKCCLKQNLRYSLYRRDECSNWYCTFVLDWNAWKLKKWNEIWIIIYLKFQNDIFLTIPFIWPIIKSQTLSSRLMKE